MTNFFRFACRPQVQAESKFVNLQVYRRWTSVLSADGMRPVRNRERKKERAAAQHGKARNGREGRLDQLDPIEERDDTAVVERPRFRKRVVDRCLRGRFWTHLVGVGMARPYKVS